MRDMDFGMIAGSGRADAIQMATCRGAELFEVATFPTRTPRISGTSLFFSVDGAERAKLVELPLAGFRPGGQVVVRIGVTRSACARGCIAEPNAMAPAIALADGINIVSIEATGVGAFVGADFREGVSRVCRLVSREVGTLVAPSPGQSFSMEARFHVERESTRVCGSLLPYTGEYLSSRALDGSGLKVVLLSGTAGAGSYLLDWIALGWDQRVAVQEPAAIGVRAMAGTQGDALR